MFTPQRFVSLLLVFVLLLSCKTNQKVSYKNKELAIDARVADLLSRMTLVLMKK